MEKLLCPLLALFSLTAHAEVSVVPQQGQPDALISITADGLEHNTDCSLTLPNRREGSFELRALIRSPRSATGLCP